ncbi:hypothetical protein K2173_012034 [Erythroxylum novogranatense]|uniref:RCC1-like domain-containing protein n=1 Tax=Erythroxylum novogranatense TaxID=1862640 RepID=A0AAV8TEM7_9ROSI|nr:hypothetical protein K2173_012034 [Erythroxylum novogranatense]
MWKYGGRSWRIMWRCRNCERGRRGYSTSHGGVAAVWGNGDYGRLGMAGSLDSQWTPHILPSSSFHHLPLTSISCGGAHTLFLTNTGRVYATGLNDFGQLGISHNIPYSMEPCEVSGLQKEVGQISAGYHHSCAITVDGEMYMWGRNSNGQLGLGKKAEKAINLPTKVECLNGIAIKKVALASEHSVAVTGGGEALSWGSDSFGQLGHGLESSFLGLFKSTNEYTPRRIKQLEGVKVKNVAAGMLHSAFIDENGSVFMFGKGLGFGEHGSMTTSSMIGKLPSSKEVSCGGYHTCVVTSNSIDALHFPERVQGPFVKSPVDQISCGWKHTAAISCNNFSNTVLHVHMQFRWFPH